MTLYDLQATQGAVFAPDGIPLYFGDPKTEYHTALNHAVLMDRSHEARLEITGKDRLEVLHRISTNDLHNMQPGEGRATIFTNANARILDRVMVYNFDDRAIILGEPGRGAPLTQYLQRNIFFNDDAHLSDLAPTTRSFDLHGVDPNIHYGPSIGQPHYGFFINFGDVFEVLRDQEIPVRMMRRTSIIGARWTLLVAPDEAEIVWQNLVNTGVTPAGSLTYNVLRIRSGVPGAGRELSTDYIPLELGLWDEVSFTKGCYTGQEIIARMENRGRLASTLVHLNLSSMVDAPAELFHDGHAAGRLTSSVASPDGEIFAMGVVKVKYTVGSTLQVGQTGVTAQVGELLGAQPPFALTETN